MKRRGGQLIAVLTLAMGTSACDRSPHAFAQEISGLAIPSAARVLSFTDEAVGIVGEDLLARVELQLTPSDFSALTEAARRLGYVPITERVLLGADPVNQFGISERGVGEAQAEVPQGSEGLFRYVRETPTSYTLVVLDSSQHRLVVQAVVL